MRRNDPRLGVLRQKCLRWATDNLAALKDLEASEYASAFGVPDDIYNRLGDKWESFFMIAQVVGGDWPEKVKAMALHYGGVPVVSSLDGTRLLTDIRDLWMEHKRPAEWSSGEICTFLAKMPEGPWKHYRRGEPIDSGTLARLLKPYDISPRDIHVVLAGERKTVRGYAMADFKTAFEVYVRDAESKSEEDEGE